MICPIFPLTFPTSPHELLCGRYRRLQWYDTLRYDNRWHMSTDQMTTEAYNALIWSCLSDDLTMGSLPPLFIQPSDAERYLVCEYNVLLDPLFTMKHVFSSTIQHKIYYLIMKCYSFIIQVCKSNRYFGYNNAFAWNTTRELKFL